MKFLAFDTCGERLTVAVKNGEKTYALRPEDGQNKHSAAHMPAVEELLNQAGLAVDDLDFIACVVGPGSFTGIRIGVSAAKALAFAAKKPVVKLTSFDVLAYSKRVENGGNADLLCLVDAKHGNFYACRYRFGEKREVFTPTFIGEEEIKRAIADGAEAVSDADFLYGKAAENIPEALIAAAEAFAEEMTDDVNVLEPLYVKKPQAEVKKTPTEVAL